MATTESEEDFQALKIRSRHRLVGASLIALFLVVAIPALLNHPQALESKDPEPAPAVLPDPTSRLPEPGPEVKEAEAHVAPVSSSEPAPASPLPTTPSVIPPMVVPGSKPAEPSPLEPVVASAPVGDKAPEPIKPEPLKVDPVKPDPVKESAPLSEVKKSEAAPKEAKLERGWFVQIGVFAEEARANDLQARFKEKGVELKADTLRGPRGVFTRLRAGPFEDRSAANTMLARVKTLGENAILVHQ